MFAYTVTVVSVYKYFQFARIIAFLGYCHEKTFFFTFKLVSKKVLKMEASEKNTNRDCKL